MLMPTLALASGQGTLLPCADPGGRVAARSPESNGPRGTTTLARQFMADAIFDAMNDASDPVPALKRQLAQAIMDHLGTSGQVNIASRLGVDQPRASNLQHGRLQRFSLQQLVRFVARADGEVTLGISWRSRRVRIIRRQRP